MWVTGRRRGWHCLRLEALAPISLRRCCWLPLCRIAVTPRLVPVVGDGPVYRLVRKIAPPFAAKALVNGEFKHIKSDEYKGKYWVLFFYPLDLYLLS